MFSVLISTLFIAVGLTMDAFSVAGGAALKKNVMDNRAHCGMPVWLFQFVMSLLDYVVDIPLTSFITQYGNWIVFFPFLFVGGKMDL